jgi:hypothetical protein
MGNGISIRAAASFLAFVVTLGVVDSVRAGIFINEICHDTTGSEIEREYVELRGDTPGMSLADHWLVVLEGEGSLEPSENEVGRIDTVIDLSTMSLGSNGFLVLTRAGNP